MPKALTGANTWHGTIRSPANGDKRSAQSVEAGLQDCADNLAYVHGLRPKAVMFRTASNVTVAQDQILNTALTGVAAGDLLVFHVDCTATGATPGQLNVSIGSLAASTEFGATTAQQNCSLNGAFVALTANPSLVVEGAVDTVKKCNVVVQVFGPSVALS